MYAGKPTLIFAVSHNDPITSEILTILAAELSVLGYKFYFAEQDKTMTVEKEAGLRLCDEETYLVSEQRFKEKGLDMLNKEHQELYIDLLMQTGRFTDLDLMRTLKVELLLNLRMIISRLSARRSHINFLSELVKNKINYVGIDADLSGISIETICTEPTIGYFRDDLMAMYYLLAEKEKTPVFGEVGLNHIEGIQKKLLKELGKNASLNYCFFNIYSSTNEMEYQSISDEANLPFGIIPINANKLDKREIVSIIIEQIKIKQESSFLFSQGKNRNSHNDPYVSENEFLAILSFIQGRKNTCTDTVKPDETVSINHSIHSAPLLKISAKITQERFNQILTKYKSTSPLSCLCLFSSDRSIAIRELRKLSTNSEITKEHIQNALRKDSQRRLTLFNSNNSNVSNKASTDSIILELSNEFNL